MQRQHGGQKFLCEGGQDFLQKSRRKTLSCARRILRVKVSLSKLGSHSARAMQGDKIKTTNSKFAKKYLKCEYL